MVIKIPEKLSNAKFELKLRITSFQQIIDFINFLFINTMINRIKTKSQVGMTLRNSMVIVSWSKKLKPREILLVIHYLIANFILNSMIRVSKSRDVTTGFPEGRK